MSAAECDRDHLDGCLTETTWDEDDCTCPGPTFASHVEALDAALEQRLDGDHSPEATS